MGAPSAARATSLSEELGDESDDSALDVSSEDVVALESVAWESVLIVKPPDDRPAVTPAVTPAPRSRQPPATPTASKFRDASTLEIHPAFEPSRNMHYVDSCFIEVVCLC